MQEMSRERMLTYAILDLALEEGGNFLACSFEVEFWHDINLIVRRQVFKSKLIESGKQLYQLSVLITLIASDRCRSGGMT
jgi:hypothetical protein